MSVDVTTRIVIARPRAAVAAYAADPDNVTAWYRQIEAVEWRTRPPLRIGSRIAFRARFLGRTLEYIYEVREHVPGERLVMGTAGGRFPMETTYTWADAPGGTEMALRNRGGAGGLARLADPLMARAVRRNTGADLRALKRILESS
jgi:uncharacterized membrane protein